LPRKWKSFPKKRHSEILGQAKKFSVPPNSAPGLRRCSRPINVVTLKLAFELDWTKVSLRNAPYILAAAAKWLGHEWP